MSRKGYPFRHDIERAILEIINSNKHKEKRILPFELCKEVSKKLEKHGFYTGHINVKRVWKIFVDMIRKNKIKIKLESS
jgi:hypothetical protein